MAEGMKVLEIEDEDEDGEKRDEEDNVFTNAFFDGAYREGMYIDDGWG